ncbi:MAG: 3'(2'),5'-bisphosphate nucleotidase [Alphaproteobacteria bacterium]|nr:MAG: 3'(2'),5'-bisphosphate nucleotidase [Alphaproteobacteria bacterium]
MDSSLLIPPLITAVFDAGREIMDVAEHRIAVREKDDRSPVTEADERAEWVILKALRVLTPGIPVIAEEQVANSGLPEVEDGPFWLVDPLDGTKEFLRGGDDFTVNIALVEKRQPSLGIVYCPKDGRLFAGRVGEGAWQARLDREGNLGARQPMQTTRPAPSPLRIVASRSHRNAETDAYLAHYPDAELVSIGSSLKFCLVAAGEADLYPRLGPTMEWDTAAGHAVLLAAGGRMVDAAGEPFTYFKPDFRNGFFLAWGDPEFTPVPLAGADGGESRG